MHGETALGFCVCQQPHRPREFSRAIYNVGGYMAVLQFSQEIIMCIEGLCNIPHQCSSHIFAIVSECEPHRSVVLQFLSQVEVLPQYRHEYLIKNNGLVGVGIEVPIHEDTLLFHSGSNYCHRQDIVQIAERRIIYGFFVILWYNENVIIPFYSA